MTEDLETSTPDGAAGLVPRWLRRLGIVAAILMVLQCFAVSFMSSSWSAPIGVTGIHRSDTCDAARFCPVIDVQPGSPGAAAGIVSGDAVRLDRYWEHRRTIAPGEHRGMVVRHRGTERAVEVVAAAGPPQYAPTLVLGGLASAAVCLVALLILVRAGRRPSSFLLGCALVSIGVPGGYPRLWENEPELFPWFFVALAVAYMAAPVLMLLALRAFRRSINGYEPAWLKGLVLVTGAGTLIALIWGTAVDLNVAPLLGVSRGLLITSTAWSIGSLLGPLALTTRWRTVPPTDRTRYLYMWIAVSVISIRALVDPIIQATGNRYSTATWPVVLQLLSQILGALLFAYAILRHRLVDLGFAINRTLVFSILSFVTLLVFGLVEWGTEKLLPIGGREASAVIDAAVALGLFLTFHHVHGWVERTVERLFFRGWHDRERALTDFLHQSAFITTANALIERTVAELHRFTAGAGVGLYRMEGQNGHRVHGTAGNRAIRIDRNAPPLIAMRADRTPVRDAFSPNDLLLPMLHRAEVTGFVLLGPKPGGAPYRPDEEQSLAEAVLRVGLDLYALRVDELERDNAALRLRLAASERAVKMNATTK